MSFRYFLKRVIMDLIGLFLIISAVFLLLRLMPVEGYFDNYDAMTELQVENGMRRLGLDQPVLTQLANFFRQTFRFDLGSSSRYRRDYPVWKLIAKKMPVSLSFGAAALLISIPLGIMLGVLLSNHKGKPIGKIGQGYIILIQAIPAAVYYLIIQMHGSSLLNVNILYRSGAPSSAILPILSLSLPSVAGYAMYVERFMLEKRNENWVLAALAKGVPDHVVQRKHVLRNAVQPLIQQLPSSIIGTLNGSLYIESIYSIPGMGGLLVEAIRLQDNSLVQGLVLTYTLLGITGMILGDLMVLVLVPGVGMAGRKRR